MKPPAPARRASETADVHVSIRVGLRHAETGEIEPSAVIEIELLILLDHGFGIERRAEIEPALRNTADDPGLGGERHIFENALLGGDRRDALRHADAEIDHAAERQLEGTAPRDDLALVERHRLDAVERDALPPEKAWLYGVP